MQEVLLVNENSNTNLSNNDWMVSQESKQIEIVSGRLELHLCKNVYVLWIDFARSSCLCRRRALSTKARIRIRPIIVGWFCTNLKNSKTFRVDSNSACARINMNCWAVLHVRVFATLGSYNTISGDAKLENVSWPVRVLSCGCRGVSIVPGPMFLTRLCY